MGMHGLGEDGGAGWKIAIYFGLFCSAISGWWFATPIYISRWKRCEKNCENQSGARRCRMADLWMVHREEYTLSQNQLGREYAKKIADVWRGEGLIVEEQETTGSIKVAHQRTVKWEDKLEVQE